MPRFLYLMRHAQSADKQPGFSDKERELTPTGVREALQIGGYLLQHKYFPDLILSSTANRAKSTATQIVDTLKLVPDKIQLEEELFTASVRTFLAQIHDFDDSLNTVLCIGHNPTLSYLAEYISKAEIGDLPPAGLVVIQFHSKQWKDVGEGTGELVRLITPEML